MSPLVPGSKGSNSLEDNFPLIEYGYQIDFQEMCFTGDISASTGSLLFYTILMPRDNCYGTDECRGKDIEYRAESDLFS